MVHKPLFHLSGMFICVCFVFVHRNISYILYRLKKITRWNNKEREEWCNGELQNCSCFIVLLGGCIKDVESWACEEARNAYSVGVWNVDGAGLTLKCTWGTRGGAVSWDTVLQAESSRVRFPMVSLEFLIDIIPPAARRGAISWDTVLQAASSRVPVPMVSMELFIDIILPTAISYYKWVPGIFPGGKSDRCVGLTTLPLLRTDCLEIWWPQPPGTLRSSPDLNRVCFTFTSGSLTCIFLGTKRSAFLM